MADMLVRLYDLPEVTPHIDKLRDEGTVIRVANPWERQEAVDWVRNTFSSRWASECDVAFGNRPISCIVATEGGHIMGFACYDSTCKDFFGPLGVARHAQGRGIGRALLLVSLHTMATLGYAYAIIGGVGPADFYARTVGAMEIAGSTPGIYRDHLSAEDI